MKCDNCGQEHKRKRFCSNKCKDRWHNSNNPTRQRYITEDREDREDRDEYFDMHCVGLDAIEDGWDGHKDAF